MHDRIISAFEAIKCEIYTLENKVKDLEREKSTAEFEANMWKEMYKGSTDMCSICHQSSCPDGCPNREDEKVTECYFCGADICEGDTYFEIDGIEYCPSCIKSFRKEA